VSFDRIGQTLDALWSWVLLSAERLIELAIDLSRGITADHLEGAGIMALFLLGPSLAVGLFRGFWEGVRIEWRSLRGRARAIDGDTLEIRGERIRLFGVDAPEIGQPWRDEEGGERDAGLMARDALDGLIDGRRLDVKALRDDQYGRSIAVVKVDGRDVGGRLVAHGFAFASPGSARYRRAEASARRRRLGFWRGELSKPWEWRRAA
jgi:endonuclease YncB( thermonuclease family)